MLLEQPYDGASDSRPVTDDKFLSRSEAARYLGVPVSTIYQWARSGRLKCVVTLGGHMRFSPDDLDAVRPTRTRAPRPYQFPRSAKRESRDAPTSPEGRRGWESS